MNNIIMSLEIPEIAENLKSLGYKIISSEKIDTLLPFECSHADMQCIKIKDTVFVLNCCTQLYQKLIDMGYNVTLTEKCIKRKYPDNILLNCLYIGDLLVCKKDSVDIKVIEYCEKENIRIINVNQGYTKCSTAVIDDKFITADKGIFKALTENGVEGLLISPGDISLNGVDYGFIGGCSFFDDNNVYFSGDIRKHRDYTKIENFFHKQNKNIICLSNSNLYDIGGFIVL